MIFSISRRFCEPWVQDGLSRVVAVPQSGGQMGAEARASGCWPGRTSLSVDSEPLPGLSAWAHLVFRAAWRLRAVPLQGASFLMELPMWRSIGTQESQPAQGDGQGTETSLLSRGAEGSRTLCAVEDVARILEKATCRRAVGRRCPISPAHSLLFQPGGLFHTSAFLCKPPGTSPLI